MRISNYSTRKSFAFELKHVLTGRILGQTLPKVGICSTYW